MLLADCRQPTLLLATDGFDDLLLAAIARTLVDDRALGEVVDHAATPVNLDSEPVSEQTVTDRHEAASEPASG